MKERIKHLAMLVVVMAMALCVASCSDDDDEGSSVDTAKLIGTWTLVSQDFDYGPTSDYTGNEGGSITFNADGTKPVCLRGHHTQ